MDFRTDVISAKLGENADISIEALSLGGEEDVAFSDFDFSQVTNVIENVANAVLEPIKKVKPQRAQVEFGLAIAVESGGLTTLLVKGQSTANLKITLEWKGDT